jgi:hypothetical protein
MLLSVRIISDIFDITVIVKVYTAIISYVNWTMQFKYIAKHFYTLLLGNP